MLLIFCLKKNIVRLFLKVKVSYFLLPTNVTVLFLLGFYKTFLRKIYEE
jgi:hypothetical protein